MTSTGAYPPGCTQRDVDMAAPGYWDLPERDCLHCDDVGCDYCCETQPVTLDDLDEIAAAQCDCCGRLGILSRCRTHGIETFACEECQS